MGMGLTNVQVRLYMNTSRRKFNRTMTANSLEDVLVFLSNCSWACSAMGDKKNWRFIVIELYSCHTTPTWPFLPADVFVLPPYVNNRRGPGYCPEMSLLLFPMLIEARATSARRTVGIWKLVAGTYPFSAHLRSILRANHAASAPNRMR